MVGGPGGLRRVEGALLARPQVQSSFRRQGGGLAGAVGGGEEELALRRDPKAAGLGRGALKESFGGARSGARGPGAGCRSAAGTPASHLLSLSPLGLGQAVGGGGEALSRELGGWGGSPAHGVACVWPGSASCGHA